MSQSINITLAGFMGVGKSTVGLALANRLGMPFVDTDGVVEAQMGCTISEAFETKGEAAFRKVEREVCLRLAKLGGQVIAVGGGSLLDPDVSCALGASGPIAVLEVGVETLLRRLNLSTKRPAIEGDPALRRSKALHLFDTRRGHYSSFPLRFDASIAPQLIVDDLLFGLDSLQAHPNLHRLPVRHSAGSYPLWIGRGLLQSVGRLLGDVGVSPCRVGVVSQSQVLSHHGERLLNGLVAEGYEPAVMVVEDGEVHKTLETVATLYHRFAQNGLDRSTPILALGGGVVGDMAGFAAATWMRGAPFVQLPTTLLSMVDASVGGKTGVDMPQGKNLVGAFKQPKMVVADIGTLETLPAAERRAGLAEVIKHAILADPQLFELLASAEVNTVDEALLARAVQVKIDVVERDPFERGDRRLLNLGHTFGHAFEAVLGFGVRHGEAVGVGLISAAHLSEALGLASAGLAAKIGQVLQKQGLPTVFPGLDVGAVRLAMAHDKKRRGKNLAFILPKDIGDVVIVDNPQEDALLEAISAVTTH